MFDATRLIATIDNGDAEAAGKLLPLVYQELRKFAAQRMSKEQPGQSLQATPRLVDHEQPQEWNGRGHFFAAAAEAMRILVERARGNLDGGGRQKPSLEQCDFAEWEPPEKVPGLPTVIAPPTDLAAQ